MQETKRSNDSTRGMPPRRVQKMKVTKLIIGLCAISALSCRGPNPVGRAKTTIHIVDTEGQSVPDATVYASFSWSYEYEDTERFSDLTDTNGLVVFSGKLGPELDISIYKDGWYKSTEVLNWKKYFSDSKLIHGKWHPWNPTIEIVLKEKKNPIPMIVRNLELDLPELNKVYGMDLLIGDWVEPYGLGQTVDLLVRANGHRSQTEFRDWSFNLDITFPNDSDGIQQFHYPMRKNHLMGSEFRSLYEAPLNGYESAWTWRIKRYFEESEDSQARDGIGYYLRTRSNQNGLYSKIYGRISGGMRHNSKPPYGGSPYIMFTYYTNPSLSDRNLECDIKKKPSNALFETSSARISRFHW